MQSLLFPTSGGPARTCARLHFTRSPLPRKAHRPASPRYPFAGTLLLIPLPPPSHRPWLPPVLRFSLSRIFRLSFAMISFPVDFKGLKSAAKTRTQWDGLSRSLSRRSDGSGRVHHPIPSHLVGLRVKVSVIGHFKENKKGHSCLAPLPSRSSASLPNF